MDSSPPTKRRRKTKSEGTNENDKSSTSPVVVFAHGAGAPSSSDWMLRLFSLPFSLKMFKFGIIVFKLLNINYMQMEGYVKECFGCC